MESTAGGTGGGVLMYLYVHGEQLARVALENDPSSVHKRHLHSRDDLWINSRDYCRDSQHGSLYISHLHTTLKRGSASLVVNSRLAEFVVLRTCIP